MTRRDWPDLAERGVSILTSKTFHRLRQCDGVPGCHEPTIGADERAPVGKLAGIAIGLSMVTVMGAGEAIAVRWGPISASDCEARVLHQLV